MLLPRAHIDHAAPDARTRMQDHPTLLFAWWATCTSLTIILFRLAGRYIRTERFFKEDKIMALSIIPLAGRMACLHVVLLYGTNNANLAQVPEWEYAHRALGSQLVLAARIFYTIFIWIAKFTVSEFLKRLTERFWKKGYERGLRCIRIFLVATLILVIVLTLTECMPFNHFWQVSPDPGYKCRQGYAHLFSMGIADIVTDILLVVFPIPIIVHSAMQTKRKFDLILLFSLSLILIGITAARIPSVLEHRGSQQYRTVFASGEVLAATAVSNAVILGSFLRDRGVKKVKKYKHGSYCDSMDRRESARRTTIATHQFGSDEDLFRGVGLRLDPKIHKTQSGPRPAPRAMTASQAANGIIDPNWQFPARKSSLPLHTYDDIKIPIGEPHPSPGEDSIAPTSARRNMSFFDVGGLLEEGHNLSRTSLATPPPVMATHAQDFASTRRGSRDLLTDLGGFLSQARTQSISRPQVPRPETIDEDIELTPRNSAVTSRLPATGVMGPSLNRRTSDHQLQDVGGLLD